MTTEAPQSAAAAPRVLVTLCTYNEQANIAALCQAIRTALPVGDILVIDDNSPDGTGAIVRELATHDPQIHLLARPGKQGVGAATVAGFEWGIARGYDWLINLDADFSHPPEVLPRLLAERERADVVIASRYVPGGTITGWPWSRHLMSRGVNWLARWWLWLSPHDCSGSYRCYRVARLKQIDFARLRARGYAFEEEILYRCARVGCTFLEIPYTFVERRHGTSNLNRREIMRALWDLGCLGLDRLRGVSVHASETT